MQISKARRKVSLKKYKEENLHNNQLKEWNTARCYRYICIHCKMLYFHILPIRLNYVTKIFKAFLPCTTKGRTIFWPRLSWLFPITGSTSRLFPVLGPAAWPLAAFAVLGSWPLSIPAPTSMLFLLLPFSGSFSLSWSKKAYYIKLILYKSLKKNYSIKKVVPVQWQLRFIMHSLFYFETKIDVCGRVGGDLLWEDSL